MIVRLWEIGYARAEQGWDHFLATGDCSHVVCEHCPLQHINCHKRNVGEEGCTYTTSLLNMNIQIPPKGVKKFDELQRYIDNFLVNECGAELKKK